LPPLQEV